jgi:hypothetical protein
MALTAAARPASRAQAVGSAGAVLPNLAVLIKAARSAAADPRQRRAMAVDEDGAEQVYRFAGHGIVAPSVVPHALSTMG